MSEHLIDSLGTHATVFVHAENGEPRFLSEDERREVRDVAGPTDDFNVVSIYSLHVALYALQNPTPENIAQALRSLATSGDLEGWVDENTLLPLPVGEPHGWVPSSRKRFTAATEDELDTIKR